MSEPWQVRGWVGDTYTMSHAIWPDMGRAGMVPLSTVVHTYTDMPPWKPPKGGRGKGRPKFDSFADLARYNAADCLGTLLGYEALQKEVGWQKINPELVELDLKMAKIALDMSMQGIPVCMHTLNKHADEQRKKADEAREEFRRIVGQPLRYRIKKGPVEIPQNEINPGSPKQLQEILYKMWGLEAGRQTKTGLSTDFRVLQTLRGKHPGVDVLLNFREAVKILGTHLDGIRPYIGPDSYIHPPWRACSTATGRWACPTPPMQTYPKRFRDIFRAPKGYKIIGADKAQLELRIIAAFAGGELFEFINNPEDPARKLDPTYDAHCAVAKISVELTAGSIPWEQLDPSDQKNFRTRAKNVNYASIYGAGDKTVLETVRKYVPDMTLTEVQKFKRGFRERFPSIFLWGDREEQRVNSHGNKGKRVLESRILGRKRPFFYGLVPPTDCRNYPVQSTGADDMNLRTLEIWQALPPGCWIFAQTHDSLDCLAPDDRAEEVRAILDELLPSKHNFGHGEILLDAKASIGETWAEV